MDTLAGLPVVDTAVGRARLGLPSRQKTREELLKEVLVPIGCGADFSANCLLQFGYFNNAVASPCTYRSIPSVKQLRNIRFTPQKRTLVKRSGMSAACQKQR